jgi:hypothetical protein
MAAYPSVPQIVGTYMATDDGTQVDRAVNGKPLPTNFYTATRNSFNVRHECSNANKILIENHYAGDRRTAFSFTFAPTGTTHTVRYADVPRYTPTEGTQRWAIDVTLIEA